MKKTFVVFVMAIALLFASCSQATRIPSPPSASDLPQGFSFTSDLGNGYFMYGSNVGNFIISRQRQGSYLGGLFDSNVFIDMVYVGK